MRRFHSYGPVDCEDHFCVAREELVRQCHTQLIGNPEKGGHYFTIWGPRQTGKTWLLRQAKKEIENRYGDRFLVGSMSVQGVILDSDSHEDDLLSWIPNLLRDTFGVEPAKPETWRDWTDFFHRDKGILDRPTILFIDEFDSLPPKVIDRLVTLFRDMYLKRDNYLIHGLALVGVRAVLGVESLRGSPFNVQRSLHVPNFTFDETSELFRQYQDESGQTVDSEVVGAVHSATCGQPGLVCWFGELLTEKYNPGNGKTIGRDDWAKIYHLARDVEMNNTVLNLIKKARSETYRRHVLKLFTRADIPFRTDAEWCSFLYLNGIIESETGPDEKGGWTTTCKFSSPFIQDRLYNAFAEDLVGSDTPILALDPLDELADVFESDPLDLPALMQRYKDYLKRLRAKGLNPWKDQPRRADFHLTEAVGHFHLYSWLCNAIGRQCVVSPEFPTGNGKVDLHVRCGEKRGLIEVKSFIDASQLKTARNQAVGYAKQTGMKTVTIALFVPVDDETVLEKLSGRETVDGVDVVVCAIGWT